MKSYFKNLLDVNLIATLSVLIVVCVIFTMIFSKVVPGFKKNLKSKFVPYIIIMMLVYGLVAFVGHNKLFVNFYQVFLFFQISTLLLGILHVFLYRSYFNTFEEHNIWKEAFFSCLFILYVLIPFCLVFSFLNGMDYTFIMCGHVVAFMIPTWFYITFNQSIVIPSRVFMTWYFPETPQAYDNLSDEEMQNAVVLSFNVTKDIYSDSYQILKAKSPKGSTVGRIFYHLVYDYNEEAKSQSIEQNNMETPYSWAFFLKENWYTPLRQIDPNLTLYTNKIEDNSQILCYRKLKTEMDIFKVNNEIAVRELNLNKKEKVLEEHFQ